MKYVRGKKKGQAEPNAPVAVTIMVQPEISSAGREKFAVANVVELERAVLVPEARNKEDAPAS